MANKNKVVKNYIYNTAYELLRILAPLVTTPYVSRILGASGVGTYSYAQSISTYFVLLGSMGVSLYGQREVAYTQDNNEKRSQVFWEIMIFRFCTAMLGSVVFFCSFGMKSVVFRILTMEILASAIDISWFFIGMENFKIIVIRNSIIKFVGIALVFALVKRPTDVPMYTLCVTMPLFLGNISLWLSVSRFLVKTRKLAVTDITKHIRPIIFLFIPQIAIEVYAVLDKTMIGVLSSDMSQVGYYTQAQKIIRIILLIVTSLGSVMLPAMSAAYARGEDERIKNSIENSFKFVFMLSFALMFGLCAISKRFVPFFFGTNFAPVHPLIIIISPILIFIGISNVIGRQYLLPTQQLKAFSTSVISGALINFLLNLFLIKKYNAIGASIATVIAELSVTLVQMLFVRKQLPLWNYMKTMDKYIVIGIVMLVAVSGFGRVFPDGTIYMIVLVVIGVVTYMSGLVITKDEMFWQGMKWAKDKLKERR